MIGQGCLSSAGSCHGGVSAGGRCVVMASAVLIDSSSAMCLAQVSPVSGIDHFY